MKAHIKTADEQRVKDEEGLIMRTLKMACIVLSENYGFGQKRLEQFCCLMCDKGGYLSKNPEQWVRIDEYLIEKYQLGAIFEYEDLDEREKAARITRKRYRL